MHLARLPVTCQYDILANGCRNAITTCMAGRSIRTTETSLQVVAVAVKVLSLDSVEASGDSAVTLAVVFELPPQITDFMDLLVALSYKYVPSNRTLRRLDLDVSAFVDSTCLKHNPTYGHPANLYDLRRNRRPSAYH